MYNSPQRFRNLMSDLFQVRGRIAELVRITGLSRRVMEKWRDGESVPNLENLDRIALALEISPASILGVDNQQSKLITNPHIGPELVAILNALPKSHVDALRPFLQTFAVMKEAQASQGKKDQETG